MEIKLDNEFKTVRSSVRHETQETIRCLREFLKYSEIAGLKRDDNSISTSEFSADLSNIDSLQTQLNRMKKSLSRTSKKLRQAPTTSRIEIR